MAAIKITRVRIAERLRERGIRPSYQRIEIANVLFLRNEHLSTGDVVRRLGANGLRACRATIYNVLKLFVKQGLIGEVVINGKHFYDPNTSDHHHFYDVVTERLTDFPARNVTFAKLPRLPVGVSLERVEVLIRVRPEHDSIG